MRNILIFALSVFIITSCKGQTSDKKEISHPIVKIENGTIKGSFEDNVESFKGIPYAAPPVDDLRWRPTQPVNPWQGELDATQYGADCAQSGWGGEPGTITENSSEDCLFLNIWRPSNTQQGDTLPVMVWIHGGGFTGGSGSGPGSAGDELAKKGVILITFNYRLGRLGHFAFSALSTENPEELKGSYAYMDQIAALRWINDNIAAFGGNPDNVTIFGFSAGGVSVHSLLTIPDARGLFQKAISESGGERDGVLTGRPINRENADKFYKVSAETIGTNFARKHGIEGTDTEALAKLRALPVQEIVDSGQETDGEGGPRTYSGPIVDGKLVVETAESAYNSGSQMKIPLMIGSSSAEVGGSFVNNSNNKEEFFAQFGDLQDEAKAAYDPDGTKDFAEVITKFNTDWVWAEPARFAANAFVSQGQPTFIYHFDYVPPSMKERMPYGAGHGSEVPFVFNTLDARWGNPETTSEEKELAQIMSSYWTNFAKTGNPNGEGLPNWPSYNPQNNQILEIQADASVLGKEDSRQKRLNLILKAVKMREKLQLRGI